MLTYRVWFVYPGESENRIDWRAALVSANTVAEAQTEARDLLREVNEIDGMDGSIKIQSVELLDRE